jgi:hypothetical protein
VLVELVLVEVVLDDVLLELVLAAGELCPVAPLLEVPLEAADPPPPPPEWPPDALKPDPAEPPEPPPDPPPPPPGWASAPVAEASINTNVAAVITFIIPPKSCK